MKKVLECVYRSQRDNADLPLASCNTTSAVMALEASGHPPTEIVGLPEGKQPEDFLTELGDSPEAYEAMKTISPWFFDPSGKATVRPPEAPLMLDWIVLRAYGGRPLIKYDESLTLSGLCAEVDRGRSAILRTHFTASGHIVAMVGYVAVQDLGGKIGQVTHVVVEDPWGDVTKGYESSNGHQVAVPLELFTAKVDGLLYLKRGHFVTA